MKNLVLLAFIVFSLPAFSQFNRNSYRDSDEGNFHIRDGKVYYQKTYNSAISFDALEQKLQSYNTPNAGFQVKKVGSNLLNGVLIKYHLNWNYAELKTRKIPSFLKAPANATFEVERSGNGYRVTVNNIWFSKLPGKSSPKSLTLEDIVIGKGGVIFTNNKKSLRALHMIDQNFDWIFSLRGSTKDTRF